MKKSINNFSRILSAFMLSVVCMLTGCYDDTKILESLKEHQEQIDELRTLCSQCNESIENLQKVLSALQSKDYVTEVNPIEQGDEIIGYTITFELTGQVTIYTGTDGIDGTDGKSGCVPVIAVKQWTDGLWYWTIDGDWLLDSKGNMIKAVGTAGADGTDGTDGTDGADGYTPVLKIEEGYWYVSYDGGKTFGKDPVGQATGAEGYTMFDEVTYDECYVYVVMADGTMLKFSRIHENTVMNTCGGVSISVMSRDLTDQSIVLYGNVSLSENVSADSFGIAYSTIENLSAANAIFVPISDLNDGEYSILLPNLHPGATYYYTSYINIEDYYKYSEIKSFTTTVPDVISGYTDISLNGLANCYIVSKAGNYCLLATKGNSDERLRSVELAEVLWESTSNVGDLIKSVSYKDDYIMFQTADVFKEGNAVIAAKDSSGNILWSWHIWMTYDIGCIEYPDNAVTLMTCNLGASRYGSTLAEDQGLMYQWGRKDPFLDSTTSTITWPSPVASDLSTGTIEYAISHPTTIINKGVLNGDWYFTWDESTDNTRWTTSDSKKSIYDPCPYGWRVPDSDIWQSFSKDDVELGRNLSYIELVLSDGQKDIYYVTWQDIKEEAYTASLGGHYWSASHSLSNTEADALSFSIYVSERYEYLQDFILANMPHQSLCRIRCCKE